MCVIINNEKGKVIEDEWLVEAVTRNPHGGGIYDCDTAATQVASMAQPSRVMRCITRR